MDRVVVAMVAAATVAKVAMVARARDSSPGSNNSTTWVEVVSINSIISVVVAKVEATMVAAMVVSGRAAVVVVDNIIITKTDREASKVVAKVAVGTIIKAVDFRVVQAVAAVAVVAAGNSEILPTSQLTL